MVSVVILILQREGWSPESQDDEPQAPGMFGDQSRDSIQAAWLLNFNS